MINDRPSAARREIQNKGVSYTPRLISHSCVRSPPSNNPSNAARRQQRLAGHDLGTNKADRQAGRPGPSTIKDPMYVKNYLCNQQGQSVQPSATPRTKKKINALEARLNIRGTLRATSRLTRLKKSALWPVRRAGAIPAGCTPRCQLASPGRAAC